MSFTALAAAAEELETDPLDRTGSFCGGLVEDIKRRAKFYLSDFKDGFNLQCLLTSIFLYFSVFAPNVAFGSLLNKKTDGWLGVSEVILATCMCGILFGLLAGQPLIIIGATGPVLVFEQTIYVVTYVYFLFFSIFNLCNKNLKKKRFRKVIRTLIPFDSGTAAYGKRQRHAENLCII